MESGTEKSPGMNTASVDEGFSTMLIFKRGQRKGKRKPIEQKLVRAPGEKGDMCKWLVHAFGRKAQLTAGWEVTGGDQLGWLLE